VVPGTCRGCVCFVGQVHVRVLGSAAGGGFPQWNCRCPSCEAARAGAARARTQSSVAVRGDRGPWFLVNASPDVREQLEGLHPADPDAVRGTPIAGVLLTDAEIDHTAGLLLLREAGAPVQIFGSAEVRVALSDGFPVLTILQRYSGIDWHTLADGRETTLPGSSLTVEPFASGGDAPRYCDAEMEARGYVFRDRANEAVLCYVPGLARLDGAVRDRLAACDLALVDGTFWRDDELAQLGISTRSARDMGHVPLSGPDGSLEVLAGLRRPRTILVHINNSNPILLEDSPEREAVGRAGIEVAHDGLEVAL